MEENKKEIIDITPENQVETKVENKTTKQEPEKDRKGFAIASMVLGLVSIVLFCVCFISIPCGILAIIFGILAFSSSKKAMAITGFITGGIGIFISFIIFVFLFSFGFIAGVANGLSEIDYDSIYNEIYDDDSYESSYNETYDDYFYDGSYNETYDDIYYDTSFFDYE